MSRGILERIGKGLADAAVTISAEKMRTNALTQRDAAMHKYRMDEKELDRTYKAADDMRSIERHNKDQVAKTAAENKRLAAQKSQSDAEIASREKIAQNRINAASKGGKGTDAKEIQVADALVASGHYANRGDALVGEAAKKGKITAKEIFKTLSANDLTDNLSTEQLIEKSNRLANHGNKIKVKEPTSEAGVPDELKNVTASKYDGRTVYDDSSNAFKSINGEWVAQ